MIKELLIAGGMAVLAVPAAASGNVAKTSQGATITREEARARADDLFAQLDSDHDGQLTRGEAERSASHLRALGASLHRDVAHGIGGHTARFFEHRFAQSRSVTRAQFEEAMLAHFDAMDRNHDGILTDEERQARQ